MSPNADQIEAWAEDTDDGYVRIPASAWPDLIWVLRQAEQVEEIVSAARDLSKAHDRRAKDATFWTPSEKSALSLIRVYLDRLDVNPRSYARAKRSYAPTTASSSTWAARVRTCGLARPRASFVGAVPVKKLRAFLRGRRG